MTTIAVDKRTSTMASDRQTNDRGLRGTLTKIKYVRTAYDIVQSPSHLLGPNKDVIVGIAGLIECTNAFHTWVRNGLNTSLFPSCVPVKDFLALILTTRAGKPVVYEVEDSWIPYEIEEDFYAIGSGNMAAVAALLCGKSVEEAVEIACLVDVYSGGGIDICTLKS